MAISRSVFVAVVAVVALLLATSHAQYNFYTNVTVSDPDGTLGIRTVATANNTGQKWWGFRSVSVNVDVLDFSFRVDTLGGLVSYNGLPAAILSYYDATESFGPGTFDTSYAQNVMAQAFFRLAERNSADTLVTAYGLGGSGSNQNASWSTSLGQSSDGNLHYFQMDTDLQSAVTGSWFHVTIYWYLSAVVGQIDLGDTTVTPRVLESIVKITNYPYAATGNYLVLGVAALYDNTSFSYTYNNVSSGSDGLSGLYVNVSSVCQVLAHAYDTVGTVTPVTVGSWVRSNVAKLLVDNTIITFLTNKFGLTGWDLMVNEIKFPANQAHIVYDPTLGGSATYPSAASALSVLSAILISLIACLAMVLAL